MANSFIELEEFHHIYRIAKISLIVPVSNAWPERGASSIKRVKTRMLMLFINGPSFQYYNTNKKSDVAVETVIDLNTEEIKQKIEAALENLEEEHYKGIQIYFESDESCSSEEDKDDY